MDNREAVEILKELPERIAAVIMPSDHFFDYKGALDFAIKSLKNERPKGKWGPCYEYNNTGMYYRDCPFCYKGTITGDFDFCPHCGADMRGDTE